MGDDPKSVGPSDVLADAIYLWWLDQEGPHSLPIHVSVYKAMKLADFLRDNGFIKNGK